MTCKTGDVFTLPDMGFRFIILTEIKPKIFNVWVHNNDDINDVYILGIDFFTDRMGLFEWVRK